MRWAKLLTNRESAWTWEYGYEFVPKTSLQAKVAILFSVLAAILASHQPDLTLSGAFDIGLAYVRAIPPSKEKSAKIAYLSWLLSRIWDGQQIGSLKTAPFWGSLSSLLRTLYYFYFALRVFIWLSGHIPYWTIAFQLFVACFTAFSVTSLLYVFHKKNSRKDWLPGW